MIRRATSKFAHNPAVTTLTGNQDLKLLQNLISAEKTVLLTMENLSLDFAKAAEALRAWGLVEGEDLGGILTASTQLLNQFSSALAQYATHGNLMRRQLKAVRTRSENLDDLKRQRRAILKKVGETERQWKSTDPENKNFVSRTETLNSYRKAAREMNSKIKLEEAALADYKRTSTKMWMGLKFGGLVECCEKGAIAGRFGKLVIAEIPEDMTQPGSPRSLDYRRNEVESYVANAHRGVNAVTLSTVPFVGFRDRDQYIQRQETPSAAPQTPPPQIPQTPPAAFYISSQLPVDHGESSNNRPSSLTDEGSQHAPSFPQPECSCEPVGNQATGSTSSLPYVQETFETPAPQSVHSHQHSDGTADDHGGNVPSTASVANPVASSSTTRSINAAASVLNDASTIISPAPSSDAASLNTQAAGGQTVTLRRIPGAFGTLKRDPYAFRERFTEAVEQKPVVEEAPPEVKKSAWGKFTKFFS